MQFQILIKLGLLEGELIQNQDRKFHCDIIKCRLESDIFNGIDKDSELFSTIKFSAKSGARKIHPIKRIKNAIMILNFQLIFRTSP